MDEILPCSIQFAPGWTAEVRLGAEGDDPYLAVVPPTADALLRLTTFDGSRASMDAAAWVDFAAEVHRPRGRPVVPVCCGDFAGYRTPFAPDDERWLRGWMLHADGIPLDVTYTCGEADAGRDDPVVEAMLDSLRLRHSRV